MTSAPDRPTRPVRVATLGAASSANKGAASMLQAVIDNLGTEVGPCRVSVLTTYPETDRAEPPRGTDDVEVEILSATPLQLLLWLFPLAVLARVLSALRVPRRLLLAGFGLVVLDAVLKAALAPVWQGWLLRFLGE